MATVVENVKGRSGWMICYTDAKGNRKRQIVHCSKEDADMVAANIETKMNRIRLGLEREIDDKMMLKDAIEYYFKHKHTHPKTIKRESQIFNNLLDFTGNIKIRKITVTMIDEYLNKRHRIDTVTEATLGIEYRTLRAFFNYFTDHDFLSVSPMKRLKHPKVSDKKIRFLTEDEIERLISVVNDRNYLDLILMYLHTGARREELLKNRLSWDDIDFERKTITLIGKGEKSRSVPLNKTAYEILYRRYHEENRPVPFEQNYEYMFKKISKYYIKAGIQGANIHTLRKTFGSLLVQKGVNIFTVSKLLGHSTVKVTEKYYADLMDKQLREGVNALD